MQVHGWDQSRAMARSKTWGERTLVRSKGRVAVKGARRELFSGNQTLSGLQWVRTPVEDQKLRRVVRTLLGQGKAGTQARVCLWEVTGEDPPGVS